MNRAARAIGTGAAKFSAVARRLLQLRATKAAGGIGDGDTFPKSPLAARDNLMLAQLSIRRDDPWHRFK
jgi:hypothetical protein